jgi:2-octaprenyl-6-methoxyphenol hydroxylase
MPGRAISPSEIYDVLVAGAGLAGLTAALGFARAGFRVALCGANEPAGHGRTVAMLDRTARYLAGEGLWEAIESRAAPLRALRLVDDTGSLFAPRPIEFHCGEIGLEAFGWNVENDAMADELKTLARQAQGIARFEPSVASYDFSGSEATATLADGSRIAAKLVVGADGRGSPARKAADLSVRVRGYPQSALTVFLSHRLPHRDFSTEFHTAGGPFTLVPLPPTPAAAHRSSLVWAMASDDAERRRTLSDEALGREIERQAQSLLGAMRIEGKRGVFPMVRQVVPEIVGPRLALVGDAAHAFPPIGAQGLNLGLRDVAQIVALAKETAAAGGDIGACATLERYASARRPDIALRSGLVDGLDRALLARSLPIDLARGFGLAALAAIGPLRRAVMREGVAPMLGR